MHQQLNIFLLAFGGLQGLLLCILLLRKKAYRAGYLFLLLYLLVMLLQVLMKLVSKMWLLQNMQKTYWLSYDLPFLYGPLLYWFVLQMVQPGRKFRYRDAWHVGPFLYFTSVDLYFATHPWTSVAEWLFVSRQTACVLQLFSLFVYHIGSYRLLQKQAGYAPKTRLLKQLTVASFLVTAAITLVVYVMFTFYPRLSELRYLFIGTAVFLYWVSYQVMSRPELFALRPNTAGQNGKHGPLPASLINGSSLTKKYHNSTLKASDMDAILAELSRIMQSRRPYLDPELSIDTLAAAAGTNRHCLSQAINERLEKNFYDYLNGYRVKTAQRQLADPENGHLKIAAIAYDSGFNSLSTFNEVFKKMSGQTPSEYRRVAQNGYQKHGV